MADVTPTRSSPTDPAAGCVSVGSHELPSELMTVTQAARWLGLSRSTLYEALAAHRIAVMPIDLGGQMRLSRRQLERCLEGPAADQRAEESPPPALALSRGASVYDDVFRLFVLIRGSLRWGSAG